VTNTIAVSGCNIAYNTAVATAVDAFETCNRDALDIEVLCLVLCGLAGGASGGIGFFPCVAGCLGTLALLQSRCATNMATALRTAQGVRAACIGAAKVARTNCLIGADAAYDACLTQAMTDCADAVALCP
jgi:hypothetical protein